MTAHLETIEVPPEPGAALDPPAESGDVAGDGFMSSAKFRQTFCAMLSAPNLLISPPLQTLRIDPEDPQAAAAAEAAYDLARRVPWLNWLLREEAEWMQSAAILGMFVAQLAGAARAELVERAKVQRAQRQAGNDAAVSAAAGPAGPAMPVDSEGRTILGSPADLAA